MTPEGKI